MEHQPTGTIENDLASRLEALSSQMAGVTIERFKVFLKDVPEKMSVVELKQILDLASEQVGIWEAAYSFSPAHSPNVDARSESEQWEQLWNTWSTLLIERAPAIADDVRRKHRLIVARRSVEASLQCKSGKPLQRLTAAGLSRLAIGLGRLGVAGLSERLYALSLYPKGSVGRGKP